MISVLTCSLFSRDLFYFHTSSLFVCSLDAPFASCHVISILLNLLFSHDFSYSCRFCSSSVIYSCTFSVLVWSLLFSQALLFSRDLFYSPIPSSHIISFVHAHSLLVWSLDLLFASSHDFYSCKLLSSQRISSILARSLFSGDIVYFCMLFSHHLFYSPRLSSSHVIFPILALSSLVTWSLVHSFASSHVTSYCALVSSCIITSLPTYLFWHCLFYSHTLSISSSSIISSGLVFLYTLLIWSLLAHMIFLNSHRLFLLLSCSPFFSCDVVSSCVLLAHSLPLCAHSHILSRAWG